VQGVRFNRVDDLLEIFDNHLFLRYYPHYDATLAVTQLVAKQTNADLAMKWISILEINPLIKLDARIREEIIKLGTLVESDAVKKVEFDKLVKNL